MEAIENLFQSLIPGSTDVTSFLILALVLTVASLVIGFIGRFAFGKKSNLNQSVCSTIGILFMYMITVVIHSFGLDLAFLVSPLPFVSISGDTLAIFPITSAGYVAICGEILNMIILAFLANLVNSWIPQGKKLFSWFFFRLLSIFLGMLLFAFVNILLTKFLPQGLLTWAPVIILGLLVIMLLVGALKGLVGAVLVSVNPLIGFLYTFFFATLVGKMLSKAMLTTLFMAGIIYALNYFGITAIAIGAAALTGYIPLLIILVILWFVIGKVL